MGRVINKIFVGNDLLQLETPKTSAVKLKVVKKAKSRREIGQITGWVLNFVLKLL